MVQNAPFCACPQNGVTEDPEYYCIGCNLQLLYVIWWIRHHLGAGVK
jgi:hypothetical protein